MVKKSKNLSIGEKGIFDYINIILPTLEGNRYNWSVGPSEMSRGGKR